jgi:soluble lytic murein transglycosylase
MPAYLAFAAALGVIYALSAHRPPADPNPIALAPASERTSPAAARDPLVEVRAGLEHSAASRPDAAAAAYARAVERLPAFAPWAHMLSASAAAKVGDTAAVRVHHSRSDPALVRDWGWRARVDAAVAARDAAGAVRLAMEAAPLVQDVTRRAEAWARVGTLHARANRHADARAAFRQAIDAGTGTAGAVEAARMLAELPATAAEDWRRIGRVYLRHGNFARATDAVDRYIAAASPPAAERAVLQLELGRGLFNGRQYATAERRLRAAISAAGTAAASRETAAEATFLLGRSQYRQGRTTDGRATFGRVTREFAGTTAAAQAHFILADLEHDDGRIEAARTHYRAVLDATGPDVALAAVRLGTLALLEDRPADAARMFEQVHARVSGTADRQQTGYWLARSLERAGARDSARTVLDAVRRVDPFTYYGLRAGELLDVGPWDFARSEPAPVSDAARLDAVAGVDVVDLLRSAGLDDAASFEALRLQQRFADRDGALYVLGEAYHEREQTFNGIRIGRELLRREGAWNRRLLQLVYPFPYRDEVMRWASANNLDPFLMAGLIRQESMFNARARSAVGAMGLMQVMPATGTRIAQSLGIRPFTTARLNEPGVNLRIGARYLADQIRAQNGRMTDVLAAYNAGPTRIANWRRSFPEHRDPEIFAERIPFQETRDYVRIVQQNARIYRELYGR